MDGDTLNPNQPLIYIGRFLDGSKELKIGRTTQALESRRRGMPGQSSLKFEMLRVFPCVDDDYSERLAHGRLDELKARPKGSRKELFKISLKKAIAICTWAAKARPATRPQAWVAPVVKHSLQCPSKDWKALLEVCVTYNKAPILLGELMSRSLADSHAARRLNSLGVVCEKHHDTKPEFSLTIGKAKVLMDWIQVRDLKSFLKARQFSGVFRLKTI